jgi:hypothetical protein
MLVSSTLSQDVMLLVELPKEAVEFLRYSVSPVLTYW